MTERARVDHMARWTFFGRILPERIPMRMELPPATVEQDDFGLTYETHVGIADGQFVADVTITKGDVDIHTLRNLIERHLRTTTDLIGYQNGFGYDVEVIATVCRDTGERCIFGPVIPVLSQRRGGAFATSIEGALYLAVLKEVSAQIVLANFREAIRIPVDSGFFCYRAIDAMMQSVRLTPSEKETRAWDRLRLALSVDKAAIDLVKSHADAPRHGRPSAITDSERSSVFQVTDEIIRRYLTYLTRGRVTLPATEFPLLKP